MVDLTSIENELTQTWRALNDAEMHLGAVTAATYVGSNREAKARIDALRDAGDREGAKAERARQDALIAEARSAKTAAFHAHYAADEAAKAAGLDYKAWQERRGPAFSR